VAHRIDLLSPERNHCFFEAVLLSIACWFFTTAFSRSFFFAHFFYAPPPLSFFLESFFFGTLDACPSDNFPFFCTSLPRVPLRSPLVSTFGCWVPLFSVPWGITFSRFSPGLPSSFLPLFRVSEVPFERSIWGFIEGLFPFRWSGVYHIDVFRFPLSSCRSRVPVSLRVLTTPHLPFFPGLGFLPPLLVFLFCPDWPATPVFFFCLGLFPLPL